MLYPVQDLYICRVVHAGRTFIQGIIDLSSTATELHHWNKCFRLDLRCLFFCCPLPTGLNPSTYTGKTERGCWSLIEGCPLLLSPADSGWEGGSNPAQSRPDGGSGDQSARLDVGGLEEWCCVRFVPEGVQVWRESLSAFLSVGWLDTTPSIRGYTLQMCVIVS